MLQFPGGSDPVRVSGAGREDGGRGGLAREEAGADHDPYGSGHGSVPSLWVRGRYQRAQRVSPPAQGLPAMRARERGRSRRRDQEILPAVWQVSSILLYLSKKK